MRLADMGGIIWLIIIVGLALVKGWSKLQQTTDDDSTGSGELEPVRRPKTQIPPPRPRLQPRPVPMPMPRSARLPQPAGPRSVPRAVPPPIASERKVGADDIRRFIEQLSGQPQSPPPVAPPPVRTAEPPPPPPKPEPVEEAPVAAQTIASAPAPAQTSRASQWMAALRDRNNVRNIIISAEIIGPPRSETM